MGAVTRGTANLHPRATGTPARRTQSRATRAAVAGAPRRAHQPCTGRGHRLPPRSAPRPQPAARRPGPPVPCVPRTPNIPLRPPQAAPPWRHRVSHPSTSPPTLSSSSLHTQHKRVRPAAGTQAEEAPPAHPSPPQIPHIHTPPPPPPSPPPAPRLPGRLPPRRRRRRAGRRDLQPDRPPAAPHAGGRRAHSGRRRAHRARAVV